MDFLFAPVEAKNVGFEFMGEEFAWSDLTPSTLRDSLPAPLASSGDDGAIKLSSIYMPNCPFHSHNPPTPTSGMCFMRAIRFLLSSLFNNLQLFLALKSRRNFVHLNHFFGCFSPCAGNLIVSSLLNVFYVFRVAVQRPHLGRASSSLGCGSIHAWGRTDAYMMTV